VGGRQWTQSVVVVICRDVGIIASQHAAATVASARTDQQTQHAVTHPVRVILEGLYEGYAYHPTF